MMSSATGVGTLGGAIGCLSILSLVGEVHAQAQRCPDPSPLMQYEPEDILSNRYGEVPGNDYDANEILRAVRPPRVQLSPSQRRVQGPWAPRVIYAATVLRRWGPVQGACSSIIVGTTVIVANVDEYGGQEERFRRIDRLDLDPRTRRLRVLERNLDPTHPMVRGDPRVPDYDGDGWPEYLQLVREPREEACLGHSSHSAAPAPWACCAAARTYVELRSSRTGEPLGPRVSFGGRSPSSPIDELLADREAAIPEEQVRSGEYTCPAPRAFSSERVESWWVTARGGELVLHREVSFQSCGPAWEGDADTCPPRAERRTYESALTGQNAGHTTATPRRASGNGQVPPEIMEQIQRQLQQQSGD